MHRNNYNDQHHIFIRYKTGWLNGQQLHTRLDIYVMGSWINRLNKLVDILRPRNNDLNNMDTKGSCINTFLTWIFLYLLDVLSCSNYNALVQV
jgi:hypothetical protein